MYAPLSSELALTGCQTASEPAPQTPPHAERLASYVDSMLDVFERDATGVRPVGAGDADAGRIFLYESDPIIVTTTLPPYVPASRTYNDPSFGARANNFAGAVGTVPGLSRSTVQVCAPISWRSEWGTDRNLRAGG